MFTFFYGWRRKLGMATLLIACAVMGGWIRSQSIGDNIYRMSKNGWGFREFDSIRGNLVWYSTSKTWFEDEVPSLHWDAEESPEDFWSGDSLLQKRWTTKFMGFAIGEISAPAKSIILPIDLSHLPNRRIWVIPHWMLVLPLTLISAYLLLSRPRAAITKPATEIRPVP